LYRLTNSEPDLGKIKKANVTIAEVTRTIWKGSTIAPAMNPNLAINIWSAQKAENISTLKSRDELSCLIGFLLYS
jgi:hypothetical protein